MRLPPESVLLAARRWLEILPSSGGIARAQAILTTHQGYSDLTPTQYATALSWLRDLGLLETVGSPVPVATRVLGAIFERAAPTWVRDADQLVRSEDELPSDILSAGAVLGADGHEIYGQLVASWGKVDTATRERVGAAGESALVSLLRRISTARIDHVSEWSDGYGYDIAVSSGENVAAHLEVKSTTRVGRFTAYLSRNEYNVMRRDGRWQLVAVRLDSELEITGVGHVPSAWIRDNAPSDRGTHGTWASCKLEIPSPVIASGIPSLASVMRSPLPSW